MFVCVDECEGGEVDGFSYTNKFGALELVKCGTLEDEAVEIVDSSSGLVEIYYEDIPRLIKALKAAYKYKTGETI